jgi:hypothetical protein
LSAPIAEALQLLLEGVRAERLAGVQLQRLGEDLRRQRPAPTLELRRDDAVEVNDPDQQRDEQPARYEADAGENRAFGIAVEGHLGLRRAEPLIDPA